MAATVSGYSHVAISVTDLDAARDFYCDVLGFEELPRPDFGFPGLWLRVGSLQLHLGVAEEPPSPGAGFPHFAIYVPSEQFDATIDAVRAAGVKMLGEPSTRVDFSTTVHAAFITDPSGNVIELTDVGPLTRT
ncbi:MAG TPA: VOC family protein [Acidimicrobiia bacterium]|nr:VOC family protein [Acidimicrobiia bacterium]